MGASNFLHNKAQERAKKIDSKYGEGAYGGTLWQSQMQNASSYSQDNVSESGSFLQRKIAQRQAAKTNTPSSNASYKKEYGTNVSTSGIYSQPVLSATEYQKEIDRLTNEKSDYSKKWREEYISKFIAGDEEWNKYQNALKDYDRQIEEMKAGKWKAEKSAKYGNLSSNADYAEKSKVIDKTLGTTFGVTIGDNFYGIGDDVYAYVNDIGKRQSLSKFSGNTGDAGMYKYSYMTQQEKDNYNYLYQTEGKKSANDYLDYISYDLDARRTKDLSGQWSEFADEHPVAASALSVPSNLMSGIGLADVAVQNIERSISGEYKPINYNSVGMNATNMTTAIRGTVSQNLADEYGTININSEEHPIFARILNGKSLGDVYQLGMSMVDSAATAAIGSVTGIGAFGTILLGGSAGSQGVLTALEKGATDEQALAMGLLNGTFEALFEFVSIDKLLKGNTKSILKAFFEQGFVEGTEELNTTLFNTIADICVMAENSDYQNMIKSYLEKGYSQKDAERMAMQDIAIGMGWDFIGGAISGGIMGGGKTAINNTIIEPHYYSNTYGQSVQELVSESLEINPGNKLASEIKSKLDSNKNVSGRKIMQLVNQNESDMVSNDKAAIQKAAARQLTSYGETGDVNKIAQAITKQVSGEKLTQSDRSLISQSKYGQRVANELNAENINSGEYNTSWAETLGTSRINPKEYSRLLQEANNEPQSDSAHQQSVYTAPAENAQQAQTVAQREAVQDAEKESAAETTYQDSNAEAPAAVGAAAIAEASAAEDVSANDDGSAIKAASVKYGAQAGAFLHTYQPGQDVKKYDDAYRAAYDMGKSGVPMRTVKSMGSVSYLTEAQREYAYEAGQAASDAEAKAQEAMNGSGNKRKTGRRKGTVKGEGVRISDLKKTFNDPQNKSYRILTKFAEATGIDIVLYNSHANENGDFTAANGRFSWREDKIYIDINAGLSTINDVGSFEKYTMLRTFSHEFLHFLEKWNPVQYNEFRRVVFDAMNEKLALKNADSETKITLDDIINERMDKWNKGIDKMNEGKAESEKAPHVTYEQASREVVAEAMTDILPDSGFMDELYNNHRNLFTKIVEKLKEFLADLKAYFSSITPNNRMEAALLKEDVGGTIRYMQSIVDAFDKLALGGVENYQQAQAEQELTNAGIIVDNSTDSASISSYSVRYLLDDKQKEKVTASLVKRFGVTKEEATNWLTAETSIASLVLNPKYSQYLDYEADPDEVAIKKNSDYPQGTVDFSPICKKRREFTSVMNAVFRQFPNHVFAATDLARIRTIMGEEGMTLPCGICYVEDRRQLDSIVAQDFLNGLKLYREGSTTRPDGKPFNTNQLRGLRYTDGDSYVPTIAELITLDGQNELKKKNPNMSEAWRRYNNARGMQSVRRLANEAEYKRQILKYSQKTVKSKNDNGGLRIYSFSDAEMFHLIDIIQIITDSSSVGLCLQGYTKVNEYAKAVRNTGEKLNRSLIPLGDLGYHMENGKVVLDFDTVEGIDINDPAFFDNSDNPDVGNIVIGINDTQIRAAMVSPFIDQIIPFHTGQSEEVLKEKNIDAWDNYKDYQKEKDISTGKASKHQINIYTEVIQVLEAEGKTINKRTFVEKFLQVCKENGLTPRFAQFLNTDANGDYVYTEGYHKMLVDFKTFAQTETGEYLPQMPVKPVFDDTYLGEILKAYVEEQTAKDSRVARSMPKVVERIANEIIQPSQEQNYEQYSVRVTDKDTLDFLNQQEESGDVIKTYKAMQVIDGKLYPPMAAKVKDENGKYRLSPPAAIGVWQQSVEDPSHLKKDKEGNILLKKNKKTGVMYGSYDLNKGNGKTLSSIAYAPYEHSSNVVLNDQFEEAYQRPNIVTVECIIPKSEMTSGYRAPYAKDATGILDWKEGVVARQLSNNHRKVYLSRYLKPVRILSNAETAQMYKQILDNEENVTVPFNVVTPGLLAELEKLDVPIDYEGSPNYRSHNKKDQYSIRDDAPAEIHKAVTDKNYGGDIRLTDTSPSIMLGHKGVKNLPMLMKASHVRENILTEEEAKKLGLRVTPDINYHGLGEELFKKVIDSLDDINVAYRGTPKADDPSRRENCFLLLSTVKDSNGDTIIVPVYINETGSYNRVFIKTNKIASVYGKNGLDEYIRNEIKKGNLVRIKKRGPTSSESPAPIAVDYAGVTSAEEAADQTAMASYADSITPDGKNSQEQNQVRESNLSDADVLVIAADAVKNNDERYNWLTAGEKDALNIFLKKATTLKEAQQKRYELLDRKKWLMDNKDTRQRGELAKVQNNLDTVNAQIRRAQDEILKVEDQKVIRKVLKQARRVVERDSLQRGLEELQAYKNKRNDTESARKYRQRVVDTAMEMSEWLRKNSDKEHVPEILKKPVLELLTSIDFSSKRFLRGGELTKADKKFGANLAELQKLLNGQQGAIEGEESAVDNIGAYLDISVENRQFLNDLVNTLASVDGTFTINKMTAEELKSFSKFLSNLATAIRKANKTLANARYQNIPDIALSSMRHMEEMGNAPASDGTPTAKFLKWTNTTPYYAFKRFGEAGEALFDGFTRGWEKLAFNAQEIIDFTNKTYTAKEIRKWRSEIHDITLEDGRTVQMTTAQIMELSQLLNREQARKHIEAGGIRIGTIQTKKGPKNDTEHYHFTVNDLKNVVGLLNDRQLQVAEELRRYMGRRGGEWGNEISMARFGYQFYTEGENYYTIRTDANGRPLRDTDEQTSSMFRLLNLSSSKSLNPNANNALIVSDIFDTFADHMADMAKLNALGLPLLDAIKWYNYTERFNNSDGTMDEEGVKKSMEKAFGTAAGSYFRTLLKDINGVKESGDRGGNFASRMMSNYKVAAVGANLRVALLQRASYVRAMYVLKPKNMIAALAFKKNAYKEAMQYSGTAVWKSLGYYDTDIAKSMRSQIEHDDTWLDKVKDKSLALAELGDQRTWGRLWVACKLEAKERNSSLTGEELCRATSDIFREVIYATQVMDSTLTRSEMMRGSTRWTKLTTAFMAEPTLSLNILGDWVSQFTIDKRKTNLQKAWSKNRGKFALAVTTYVCSAAAAALMESIMDAFRDDDDYETFLDKFLQAFLGEEGFLDGNLGQDLTVIGKIPVLKDIISTIRGIKSSDMSLAAITSISNAYAIWKESIALANGTLDKATNVTWYGKMTDWGKIYKTLQALSQLTGVSLSNMTRDVVAIWNTTVGSMTPGMKIKTYDPGEKNSIKYAYQDGYLTEEEAIDKLLSTGEAEDSNEAYWIVNEWSTGGSKYDAMKEAIKANDSAAYNNAMSELTGHGIDEESALTEARKAIHESYASGEINDSQAVSYLQKYGGKEEDKARESVELWKFKAASDEYDDIKASAVAKYNEYCAGTGMSKDTYYKAWSVIKDIRGEDRNGDGTNDAYSAMDKKLDYIGSLSISYDQKYALALASGISEKNIRNRANW